MKKKIFGLIYIFVTLGITLYVCFYTTDFTVLANVLGNINWLWIIPPLLLMVLYVLLEAFPQFLIYRRRGYKMTFGQQAKIGLIGLYYSGITPSSSGGQPMQVVYLSKMNLPIGLSSYLSTLKTFFFQAIMTIFCFTGYMTHLDFVRANYSAASKFVWLGLGLNVIMLTGMLLLVIKPAILQRFTRFVSRILAKFIGGRKTVPIRRKALEEVKYFHKAFKNSQRHPSDYIYTFLVTLVQITAYLSISFFIHKAFGLPKESFFMLFSVQALVVCAVSFIPLPGSAGAQEVGYYSFFLPFFGEGAIFPAMILWRILTSYLTILTGAGVVMVDTIISFRKNKKSGGEGEHSGDTGESGGVGDSHEVGDAGDVEKAAASPEAIEENVQA